MKPEHCPQCGSEVPPDATACPECGSCEETGWSDSAHADRLGIPDPEFDYGEFVAREFGAGRGRPRERTRWWLWVAVGLLGVLLAAWIFGVARMHGVG